MKNKNLLYRNLKIHCEITRESTQKNLLFHSKVKRKNYNKENKKTIMLYFSNASRCENLLCSTWSLHLFIGFFTPRISKIWYYSQLLSFQLSRIFGFCFQFCELCFFVCLQICFQFCICDFVDSLTLLLRFHFSFWFEEAILSFDGHW